MSQTLLADLSRLSSCSSALEAPKPARAIQADTKKNRKSLLEACSSCNLAELTRLAELGAPLDFHADSEYGSAHGQVTPLLLCARAGWPQGLRALLDAGASESHIEGFLTERDTRNALLLRHRCALDEAVQKGSAECFKILYPLYPAERQILAMESIRDPGVYLAAEALGAASLIQPARLRELALIWISNLEPSMDGQHSANVAREAFALAGQRFGLTTKARDNDAFWIHALTYFTPGGIQALAKLGTALPPKGLIAAIPQKHVAMSRSLKCWTSMQPSTWNPKYMLEQHTPEASKRIMAGMATFAAMVGTDTSFDNAYALCSIAALREELLAHPLGPQMLAHCWHIPLLRRLGSFGADLPSFRDESGRNPLHTAAKRNASKSEMENLARTCIDWISQRDLDGKVPSDFIDSERQSSMAVLFDKIGMRDALGGKRGPKTPAVQRKRL